ncbi:hypothetical protein B0I00_2705 [Novosphingobium kunmingense]|uniref:Uncharacterized protein n=1 Tax=Novosphingobium kunmingense TaxID=1211806 RepID=A0A2N0H585_9SPHN|nr:hypothetical protein [Novosphingobium kunmingense]PKB14077.1 hypothetical protein B0I00_2705 [Novosphingobium kunmingense]
MELGIELMNGLRSGRAGTPGAASPVDWPALQTRLVAGHCARQALIRGESLPHLRSGAFAPWAEAGAGAEWGAPVVNPIDLAVCKGAEGKGGFVAQPVARGDRG